jgi:hypothetical protein
MISIDTLSYAKRLESAGVPVQQVQAHAMALADILVMQVASKADLIAFEERITLYVKEQLAQFKVDMMKLVLATAIAQTDLLIAAMRYTPH